MYRTVVQPILFALSEGDAEKASELVRRVARTMQRLPALLRLISFMYEARNNRYPTKVCGIPFPNRIGLAAGLDKNADMILFMQALGFGFIEVGSVLPYPQPGNPRPRLFRLPEHKALINRMGFNSEGAAAVEQNLRKLRSRLEIPLIISLGKMKGTPLDDAAQDYTTVTRRLWEYGAAFTANVSSPNTPDLRKLQGKEYLESLIRAVAGAATTSNQIVAKPVFVKIAPDLSPQELEDTYAAAMGGGARGFIISNTTVTRPFGPSMPRMAAETGGLSGPPVFPLMLEKLQELRRLDENVPIVAVGGINSRDRGQEAFDKGATLIQILTGLVYEGPQLIGKLRSL